MIGRLIVVTNFSAPACAHTQALLSFLGTPENGALPLYTSLPAQGSSPSHPIAELMQQTQNRGLYPLIVFASNSLLQEEFDSLAPMVASTARFFSNASTPTGNAMRKLRGAKNKNWFPMCINLRIAIGPYLGEMHAEFVMAVEKPSRELLEAIRRFLPQVISETFTPANIR